MAHFAAQFIFVAGPAAKNILDCRMVDRPFFGIGQQILLADIGDVAAVPIFGKKMVERLVFGRANFLGNRLIPFLAIVENRIDIEDYSAKIEDAMPHDIANRKLRARDVRSFRIRCHTQYIGAFAAIFKLVLGKHDLFR
jgi:hypothetical protein